MLKLGLFGRNISHSRSKEMYEKLLGKSVDYHLLDFKNEEEIPPIKNYFEDGFDGLSVTYPYKKTFLDQAVINNDVVSRLGAINCLKFQDGIIEGTNTDLLAAKEILKGFNHNYQYITLGSGNMAKVFDLAFEGTSLSYLNLNRRANGDLNEYDFLTQFSKPTYIINCCSRDFIFNNSLQSNSVYWDMNYAVSVPVCLVKADITYIDGLNLLELQAKFALEYWGIS